MPARAGTQKAGGRWQALVERAALPGALRREAAEALAIHFEHRVRDLIGRTAFALAWMA